MKKYEFSFTACSLHVNEMIQFLKGQLGLEEVSDGGKKSSIKRKNQEFKKRLDTLTPAQTDALLNGDSILRRQLAYLSACKLYDFLREFVIEVVREKMLTMDLYLTEGEYLSFYRRKMIDHEELEHLSPSTEDKVKQVIFRMLAEGGIINSVNEKVIQYQLLDVQLIQLLENDNPKWLEVFLFNDFQIMNYTKKV
ncbi:BrxA family protein [Siphonobacter sp. BAB-5385]|uniref:BrxA family protein n=1 Tax=Siphonobacter sp. BAB-5385 TaxID=1864822 RepID=UPI001595ECF2|nr:BrxA family protein [Siphonobacter sp. BAB-5385]